MFDNKSIMITGGTGSFGQEFVKTLLARHQPARIVRGIVLEGQRSIAQVGGVTVDLIQRLARVGHGDPSDVDPALAAVERFERSGLDPEAFLDPGELVLIAAGLPASLVGMAPRDSGIDLGLSYRYRQPWGTLQAELVHDIGRTYKGYEGRLSYSYDWRSGPWTLRPNLTVAMRDARLNNYYYGVLPGEATASRPAYTAGAGINSSIGLYGTYDVSQRWRLLACQRSAVARPRRAAGRR